MQDAKHKFIFYFMTHIFLRRIGKRYPEFFNAWIADITDNKTERKIMAMRYTGTSPLKFEAIAIELHTDVRNVFKYHKRVVERLISKAL